MNPKQTPKRFILDQAGIAFRGKVPLYVANLIIQRYWKDEVGWWYLTQERISAEQLSIWAARGDWIDEVYILVPESKLWLNIDSHYVNFVEKTPLEDPDWQSAPEGEIWLVERDGNSIHITHYPLGKGETPERSPAPILLEWYKAQALRIYRDRLRSSAPSNAEQRRLVRLSVADEVTPWDAGEPDLIALLVAEPWLLNAPRMIAELGDLPLHREAKTIGDLFLQRVYLLLASTLQAEQENTPR